MSDVIPIAIEVIRTAGSLATVANFVKGWFQSDKTEIQTEDRRAVLEAVTTDAVEMTPSGELIGKIVATPSSELVKILARIPERHLKPIVDRVKQADEDYITIVQNGSMIDVKKAHGITASEVCALLKLIRRHNDGELPTDKYLHDLWDSFGCENVRTVFD